MNQTKHILRLSLFLVALLLLMALTPALAQNNVYVGEIQDLGVIEVPDDYYIWKIYDDYTLMNEAGPTEVVFIYGNEGPIVPVLWAQAGTYYFTVTAINIMGCMNLKVGVMYVDPLTSYVTIDGFITDVLCYGEATGSIDLTVLGGTPPYTFLWSNGAETEDIMDLLAGNYSVTVTDMISDSAHATFIIAQPADSLMLTYSVANPVCYGTATGAIDLSVSGGTFPYAFLWSNGSTNEDVDSLFAGIYSVVVIDSAGCFIKDTITISEPEIIIPTIAIFADQNQICSGTPVTFTSMVTNEGDIPFYQWMKNGIKVGTNDSVYIDSTLFNNDTISCKLTSSEICANPPVVYSQPILMTVYPVVSPTISITVDQNPICSGALATFSVAVHNESSDPIYQWMKNGINVGINSPVYTDNTLLNQDVITCKLTSIALCVSPDTVVSDPITMIVTMPVTPTISINAGENPVCAGVPVTFTSTVTNQGLNPVYLWMKNGYSVGTNDSIYIDSTLVSNDVITCLLISSDNCADPVSVTSNAIVMTVSPLMVATISEHTDVLCYGNADGTASVNITGGIPGYSYEWNTSPVQTSPTATNLPTGIYYVTVIDMIGCSATDSVIISGPSMPLSVVATSTDVNCVDANNGTATATVSGGTPGFTYLWDDPLAQTTETAINLTAGTYTVIVTDSNQCTATDTTTISEPVTREPEITITIDHNPVCLRTLIQFTSNVVYPGSNPVYQWTKNGVNVGTNDSVYSDSTLNNNDVINCILTSSEPCAIPATKISEGIRVVVNPSPVAGFSITELNDDIIGNIQLNNLTVGAEFYYWDFGNGQDSEEENPTVSYIQDGDYLIQLVAVSLDNCTDTAWGNYKVTSYGLYIPNAFSPTSSVTPANVFKPVGMNLKLFRIEVYDNWGHLIWESDALDENGVPTEAWDGTFQGNLMPQGTYMWKVNAIFNDNTIWLGSDIGKGKGKTIGTVTLIR